MQLLNTNKETVEEVLAIGAYVALPDQVKAFTTLLKLGAKCEQYTSVQRKTFKGLAQQLKNKHDVANAKF